MKNQQHLYLIGGIILIIAVIFSFRLGAVVQRRNDTSTNKPLPFGRSAMPMGQRTIPFPFGYGNKNNNQNNGLSGQIIKVSGNQITIMQQNGKTQTITLSNNATYTKIDQANQSNLAAGQMISVFGPSSRNGSVTAQSVRINTLQTIPPQGR